MRINWMVPVRGLIKAIVSIAKEVCLWVEIIISAPIVFFLYIIMLMMTGAKVIAKKVRRMMMPTDYTLSDIFVNNCGCFIGSIDGLTGDKAIFIDFPTSIKITKNGMIIKDEDGISYLIQSLSPRQTSHGLAKLLASQFLE
jgi:hypothetical protein